MSFGGFPLLLPGKREPGIIHEARELLVFGIAFEHFREVLGGRLEIFAIHPRDPLLQGGIGREGGMEAIKEYLQTKSVWICTDPAVDNPFLMR